MCTESYQGSLYHLLFINFQRLILNTGIGDGDGDGKWEMGNWIGIGIWDGK